jgi:mannosyltransferase
VTRPVLTPYLGAVAAISALGLALRLYHLGAEGFIPDEGISLEHAAGPKVDMVRPVYFLLLRLWMRPGMSEGLLRLPAALFGAASVPITALLGARLLRPRAGLIAALLLAVAPIHINHSQEVRMYSLMLFWVLVSFLAFQRLLEGFHGGWFGLYAASALLALLTQPTSALAILAQDLYLLATWKQHSRLARVWLTTQAGAALLLLPFARELLVRGRAFGGDWSATWAPPGARDLLQMASDLSFWKRTALIRWFGTPARLLFHVLTAMSLALILYGLFRPPAGRRGLALVALWLAVPLATAFSASHLAVNVWQIRYLLFVLPAYCLLVAHGLDALPHTGAGRLARPMLASALVLGSLAVDAAYYREPVRPDWRAAMSYLHAHLRAGDGIGVYADEAGPAFAYYYHGEAPWAALKLEPRRFRPLSDAECAELLAGLPPGRERYWLVLLHHEHRGGASLVAYLARRYGVETRQEFRYVEVVAFQGRLSRKQNKAPQAH